MAKRWTEKEEIKLKIFFEIKSKKELEKIFKRKYNSIYAKYKKIENKNLPENIKQKLKKIIVPYTKNLLLSTES